MRTQISNALKYLCLNSLIFLVVFICASGCTGLIHHADPLAGWQFCSINDLKSNNTISADYQDYIQKLPSQQRQHAGPIYYYQNQTGQHAVEILIGINGRAWRHVLIYDKNDKRIKTVKYLAGYYHS